MTIYYQIYYIIFINSLYTYMHPVFVLYPDCTPGVHTVRLLSSVYICE